METKMLIQTLTKIYITLICIHTDTRTHQIQIGFQSLKIQFVSIFRFGRCCHAAPVSHSLHHFSFPRILPVIRSKYPLIGYKKFEYYSISREMLVSVDCVTLYTIYKRSIVSFHRSQFFSSCLAFSG